MIKILSLFLGIMLVSSTLVNLPPVEAANEIKPSIPSWIRDIAAFWANGQISDAEYLTTIQWLINNNVIKTSSSSIQDKGDFYAVYSPVSNPNLQNLAKIAEEKKVLEALMDVTNSIFKLPYDIPVILSECGTANAYYNPDKKEIILCYELANYLIQIFLNLGYSEEEAGSLSAEVLFFVFFHELGHTLIDVYDLPVLGMEEDAVDQLAALMLDSTPASETTAKWFLIEGIRKSIIGQLPFWDEHSLDLQRFYNILCWAYGSSPTEYSSLVSNGLLPDDRAVKCPAEYEKISKSWESLLLPYIKDPSLSVLFRN